MTRDGRARPWGASPPRVRIRQLRPFRPRDGVGAHWPRGRRAAQVPRLASPCSGGTRKVEGIHFGFICRKTRLSEKKSGRLRVSEIIRPSPRFPKWLPAPSALLSSRPPRRSWPSAPPPSAWKFLGAGASRNWRVHWRDLRARVAPIPSGRLAVRREAGASPLANSEAALRPPVEPSAAGIPFRHCLMSMWR